MKQLRIEAYDLGIPTPLSSELDLTILVKNIDDYKPAFTQTEFVAQLTGKINHDFFISESYLVQNSKWTQHASETLNMSKLAENSPPGKERIQLPTTVDRDDEDEEEKKSSQVCYYILPDKSSNSSLRYFHVDPLTHVLSAKVKLDREKQANHTLVILAEDCHVDMGKLDLDRVEETSLIKVLINVADVNDNPWESLCFSFFRYF